MARRRRSGVRGALAALAAALPLAAGLSSSPPAARCEYACAAAACHALLGCTPAAPERDGLAQGAGCGPLDELAGAARCVAYAARCSDCPAPSAVLGAAAFAPPPANASAAAARLSRRAVRHRRLHAAEGAGAPPPLSELAAAAVAATRHAPAPGCVVPTDTVLITYTNAHHFEFLQLQRRVATDAGLTCLLERTVTLCLDDACMALCATDGVPCIRYAAYTLGAAEAHDRSPDYRTITFVKWLILHEVLGHVSAALFFDDDVLLLRNPFTAFEPDSQYDFRHQAEKGAGCLAQPNGGLLFLRATPAGRALVANMVAKKDAIEASGDKLDQDYVAGAADAAGAARCALPRMHFAGHCPRAALATAPLRGIATYHAHCCGEKGAKLTLLRRIVAAVAATPDARFADVDRVPLPGRTAMNDTCYYPYWHELRKLRKAWAKIDAALEWPAGGKQPRALAGRLAGDILR